MTADFTQSKSMLSLHVKIPKTFFVFTTTSTNALYIIAATYRYNAFFSIVCTSPFSSSLPDA